MRDLLDKDRRLFTLLHLRLRISWIDPVMVYFTRAGTKGAVWVCLAAVLLLHSGSHGRWVALLSLAALLLAEGLINLVLKPLAHRDRPFTQHSFTSLLVYPPGQHSWPSAHAGSSMAAATVLATEYHFWAPLFLAIALVISYSRVYVGVHYPLDVVTGALVGVACASLVMITAAAVGPYLHLPAGSAI